MVESKFVVLQMIPHTLFIEWDIWTLFTSSFTIHDTIHQLFLLFMVLISAQKVLFLALINIGFGCFLRTNHIN